MDKTSYELTQRIQQTAPPMELSVDDVVSRVEKIQTLMKKVMKLDEHYGIIPGTSKPTLLKPGAEKLNFMFQLVPEFQVQKIDLPDGHREYIVKCRLHHRPTGTLVAEGDGSCSTLESKYRYRKGYIEQDVGELPKKYWEIPEQEKKAFLQKLFGPGEYKPKKRANEWRVIRIEGAGEKMENKDIADTYNTVLKIAEKRAYVNATILACAVSDIFTQDVEDGIPEPEQELSKTESDRREAIIEEIAEIIRRGNFTEAEKNFYREMVRTTPTERLHLVLEDVKKLYAVKQNIGNVIGGEHGG